MWQPCCQICSASSLSLFSPNAAFTQSRATCLSFSAPTGIVHRTILSHPLRAGGKITEQDPTRTETCSASPEPGGHPAACLVREIHPMHWRLGYLVTTLCPCGAHLWSFLEKLQHRVHPKPCWDSNIPMAGGGMGREWAQHMVELNPSLSPTHRHCLHLLSPVAFPGLLQHPHTITWGMWHSLPGSWARLKPSTG